MENRKRAVDALASGCALVTLYQVHSAEAVTVIDPWEISGNPPADAMVTSRTGIALGILTADCAPVLLCDPDARVIGAAHAGWQGALLGITDSVLSLMIGLGARTAAIRAAVGPCICAEHYEVGPEFEARFIAADSINARFFTRAGKSERPHFDLPAYIAHRLQQASLHSIERLNRCTYEEDENFYSFRRCTHRKESDYGRQLSAISLIR